MRSRAQCCGAKAISITYSECVSVALIIEHAKCMSPIIFQSMACLALQYFATSYKWHDLKKQNVIEYKKCVLVLSKTFVWNIHNSKKNSAKYDNKCKKGLPVEYRLLLFSDFKETWIFLTDFRKIFKCKISWKSFQWKAYCNMQAIRQTCMTKLVVACSNLAIIY